MARFVYNEQQTVSVTSCGVRALRFQFADNVDFRRIDFKGIHPVPLKISVRGPLIQEII